MATAPNPMMFAQNPMALQLMQQLARQANPGGPGGGAALAGARQAAQTPFGQDQNDIKHAQAQVGTWVTRYMQRSPEISEILLRIYKDYGKALEKIGQLPAAPVSAPPPGLPMAGGAAMMPPAEASPFG